jgi:hypothetical protein
VVLEVGGVVVVVAGGLVVVLGVVGGPCGLLVVGLTPVVELVGVVAVLGVVGVVAVEVAPGRTGREGFFMGRGKVPWDGGPAAELAGPRPAETESSG